MATVSELSGRARMVAAKLCDHMLVDALYADEAAGVIEQALLAERRLALEEAEHIAMGCSSTTASGHASMTGSTVKQRILVALRAAAEKEVVTK